MDLWKENVCPTCGKRTVCKAGVWKHRDVKACPGPPEDPAVRRILESWKIR